MNLPDFEFIPEPMRGKTFTVLCGCYCGAPEEGQALIDGWREWQAPLMDDFATMPFAEAARISQDPEEPVPGYTTSAWLRHMDDAAVDTLVRYATLQEARVPLIFVEIRHAGGAAGREGEQPSAYGYRDAELLMAVVGMVPAPPMWDVLQGYVGRMKQALGPALSGTVYMNFLEGEEKRTRARDGYPPETLARLAALKARYDPANRLNRAVEIPAAN